jgi:hypothetical protein
VDGEYSTPSQLGTSPLNLKVELYLCTCSQGANWLFSLSSLLAKPAVRLLGERSAILLGVIAGLPAVLGLRIREPLVLALILSASNIPWAISWPVVLKVVFSRAKDGLGAEYSGFTLLAGSRLHCRGH